MALDIIEKDGEGFTCPHCNGKVILRWQEAYYGYGESSPQFIGLEKAPQATERDNETE